MMAQKWNLAAPGNRWNKEYSSVIIHELVLEDKRLSSTQRLA
jgi:hypothetical protein